MRLRKEGKGKPWQRTEPHQPGKGKRITFTDTQGHHGSQQRLPLQLPFEDNKPLEQNEKGEEQISSSDVKNFVVMWKGEDHNSVTATESGG